MKNRLEVRRQDFIAAFKTLGKVDSGANALLAFEGGYLSVEAVDRAAVVDLRENPAVRSPLN